MEKPATNSARATFPITEVPIRSLGDYKKNFFALENCTHYKVRLAILSKPRLEKKRVTASLSVSSRCTTKEVGRKQITQ